MRIFTRCFLATASILAFCGLASAYTVSGSVSDEQGKALKGVSVSLLKEGKTTTTDNQGKFTLFEDETIGFHAVRNSVGYVAPTTACYLTRRAPARPSACRYSTRWGTRFSARPCRVPACST